MSQPITAIRLILAALVLAGSSAVAVAVAADVGSAGDATVIAKKPGGLGCC